MVSMNFLRHLRRMMMEQIYDMELVSDKFCHSHMIRTDYIDEVSNITN